MAKKLLATMAIHAGEFHNAQRAHIDPIYQSSTFTFPDMAAVEAYAAGETEGYIYGRFAAPGRKDRLINSLSGWSSQSHRLPAV